jgi:hypothetical protein
MITGAHFLFYSKNPEADRAFLRDVLEFPSIDLYQGWLLFKLPPAEVAVHPAEENFVQGHGGRGLLGAVLYLICDDLPDMIERLTRKGVQCSEVTVEPWGTKTTIPLPGGGELGLYKPSHATALEL